MPPCEAARIERRKKATPQAQSAVAASIIDSSISRVVPTESKSVRAFTSEPRCAGSVARQVMDWPIAMAVLGMARTIGRSAPTWAWIWLIVTPVTTEIRVWRFGSSVPRISPSNSSSWRGCTATTTCRDPSIAARLSAVTARPELTGSECFAAWRRVSVMSVDTDRLGPEQAARERLPHIAGAENRDPSESLISHGHLLNKSTAPSAALPTSRRYLASTP